MTGLFTGIIGSIIGVGIQATFGGIPIRDDASRALEVLRRGGLPVPPANWFSQNSSIERRRENGYAGEIGQHVAGAIQALGPCMQIAKALTNVAYPPSQPCTGTEAGAPREELVRSKAPCKSAGVDVPNLLLPKTVVNVNNKKKCDNKCSCPCKKTSSTRSVNDPIEKNCKPTGNVRSEAIKKGMGDKKIKKTTEKLGNSSSPSNYTGKEEKSSIKNIRSTASIKIEPNSRIKIEPNSPIKEENLGKEIRKKGKTDPRERDIKLEKGMTTKGNSKDSKRGGSSGSSTIKKNSQKLQQVMPENKTCGSGHAEDKCQMCQAQIKNTKKAPLMSCGHIICYKCLQTGKKSSKCPKCELSKL